jgi:ribonuclease III
LTTWSAGWADLLDTLALRRFAERLGCPFSDLDTLQLALTHRSWCAEHAGFTSNERLEFLGDAVLGLVVTAHVYRVFPDMPEGELAKVRATVVSAATLAEVAAEVEIGPVLLLGKGEDGSGGRSKPSILADAMEAVIGAAYLDLGWAAASTLVLGLLEDRIEVAAEGPGGHDFKTQLQELAARLFEELPTYDLRDEGPDHAKRFYAVVSLAGRAKGEGEGRSKKEAEQAAARRAFLQLSAEPSDLMDPLASRAAPVPPAPPQSAQSVGSDRRESEPHDA